jgi:hypothetical protein
MIIAGKCAPSEKNLSLLEKAGLRAVELYTNGDILGDIARVRKCCGGFSFRYAVHAPNDSFEPEALAELVTSIDAEIVVFHNIFWEDEWQRINEVFRGLRTKPCIENMSSVHEPLKFMRRFGFGRCLDLEHLQMECAGVIEDEFIPVIAQASHIHMTGYSFGSKLWHTHISNSPRHNAYMLDLLKRAGFKGFVVSEAKVSLQTYEEFKKLSDFYNEWAARSTVGQEPTQESAAR